MSEQPHGISFAAEYRRLNISDQARLRHHGDIAGNTSDAVNG
ncbi:hypothetical protein D1AOALGA4SA_7294 [Olavius algarvensis Delta 1 endosymbiont]|nr:hypothetical protein D1AOALGA4SA_7294 [Olavius algarvensis Delta 1 endosymbiont]